MQKAIILAAGTGKRLNDLTKEIPKCLLKVDSKNVLLDYSLQSLKENKVQEIIFVTGYREEKLKEYILNKWENKFSFQFIFNDKFAEYNNIYSAYLAKDFWDDETILLNSDIIFDPEVLSQLSAPGSQLPYLIIDDKKKLNEEDMKVIIDEKGAIKKINKKLSIKNSFGEYIGITYLKGETRIKFLESLEKNIKNKKLDLYYEDALDQILDTVDIYPLSTNGLQWTEVDTKEDYEVAKKIAKNLNTINVL